MLDKVKNQGEPRPYLRNLNVRWLDFDLSDVLEMRFLPEEFERYTVRKGDVVICEGGYPGRAAIWEREEPVHYQKALHRVRFHEPERNRWFVYYLIFKDLDDSLRTHFNGSGIQHFTGEALARFEVPIPPLPEQRRIVAVLDEAFAGLAIAKANAEKNLQNARALFESHVETEVAAAAREAPKISLEAATGGVFTGPFGSLLHKADYVEGGVPLINPANITDAGIEPDHRKTVSTSTAARLAGYVMRAGDIVMGRRGEMGRCAVVTGHEDGWLCGTGSFFIKSSPRCDPDYIVLLLRSASMRARLETLAGGAVMPNLSNTTLGSLEVRLPPLETQRVVVERAQAIAAEIERLRAVCQRKLVAFEALKKSLFHQAFTGNLN